MLPVLSLACTASSDPPFDDLSLRDLLRADPRVIASLPKEVRADLGDRLQAPLAPEDSAPVVVTAPTDLAAASLLYKVDALREADEKDAIVLASLHREGSEVFLFPLSIAAEDPAPPERLWLDSEPDPDTGDLEQKALDGKAGAVLHAMGVHPADTRLVRVTGTPSGALLAGDEVFVNAAWLVALAGDGEPPPPALPPPGGPGPKPLSIDFNPYRLPPSLNACSDDVVGTCQCASSSSCDHRVTDDTFADANAECSWIIDAPDPEINAAALCALALLDIDAIRQCVASAESCTLSAPEDHDAALAFVSDPDCFAALDSCAQTGQPPVTSSGSSCGSCGSCNNCEACDNCNRDYQDCKSKCDRCQTNCSNCNERCNECGSGRSCNCTVAGRPHPAPANEPPSPFGWLWLLLPPAYVVSRVRRRS
ncbi:MAG: hypothetical protein R3F14_17610 [Polyangiaceae bacterium]